MKNLILFLVIFTLAVIGCRDIVNSDKNINSTPINTTGRYSYMKADQTHDVLMPMKLNNYWAYDISSIDNMGISTLLEMDTLKVDSIITIDNDKWFILFDHHGESTFPSQDPHILSNTDLGLWTYNGESGCSTDYLFAKYPVNNDEEFTTSANINIVELLDSNKIKSYNSKATRRIKVEFNQKINVPAGNFNCIKFTEYYENIEKSADSCIIALINTYFVENLGMIKKEYFKGYYKNNQMLNKKLYANYELTGFKLN